jgi:hypothetical protein
MLPGTTFLFLVTALMPIAQGAPASIPHVPACLAPHDARRIESARSPLERLKLYREIGGREAVDLYYFLNRAAREGVGIPPPPRAFDQILSANMCVWGQLEKELQSWKPSTAKERRTLREFYPEVVNQTQLLCVYEEGEVTSFDANNRARAAKLCNMFAAIEARMAELWNEPPGGAPPPPACLAPRYVQQVKMKDFPLERLQAYVRIGERETFELLYYLNAGWRHGRVPLRHFDQLLAATTCVWEEVLKELKLWNSPEAKDRAEIRRLYQRVDRWRWEVRRVVGEDGLPPVDDYARQGRTVARLVEEAEREMSRILATGKP